MTIWPSRDKWKSWNWKRKTREKEGEEEEEGVEVEEKVGMEESDMGRYGGTTDNGFFCNA